MPFLTHLRQTLADRIAPPEPEPQSGARHSRRQFVGQAARAGVALSVGMFLTDEAWAASDERAARLGIEPGTLVDAQGRPMEPAIPGAFVPFIGDIMYVGFNFDPRGWAFCHGQLLAISSNNALFSLLGTVFGGDGRTTFGLPDLRGRSPVGQGTGLGLSQVRWGQEGGQAFTTLSSANLPAHTHGLQGSNAVGTSDRAVGGRPAIAESRIPQYTTGNEVSMATTTNAGNNSSFSNQSPYLGLHACIALQGVFPSRN
ncbi:MAG: tail fiber protein [Bacteroidota bacterium]